MKRIFTLLIVAAFLMAAAIPSAFAVANAPAGCTKEKGTILCSTTTSSVPGNGNAQATFSSSSTATVKGSFSAATTGEGQTVSSSTTCGGGGGNGKACKF